MRLGAVSPAEAQPFYSFLVQTTSCCARKLDEVRLAAARVSSTFRTDWVAVNAVTACEARMTRPNPRLTHPVHLLTARTFVRVVMALCRSINTHHAIHKQWRQLTQHTQHFSGLQHCSAGPHPVSSCPTARRMTERADQCGRFKMSGSLNRTQPYAQPPALPPPPPASTPPSHLPPVAALWPRPRSRYLLLPPYRTLPTTLTVIQMQSRRTLHQVNTAMAAHTDATNQLKCRHTY